MKVKIPMDGDPFFLVNVCFNPVGKVPFSNRKD